MHAGFGLPFEPFKHTEFPHYYRNHEPGETEKEFSRRMAERLEALIRAEGPDTIAAFFAEPVMGAGGAILPPEGYFDDIQAVLRKYDILFVADEVICGFARTGEMWGCQTYGIRPDMITSAKALSAAMQPISAVLLSDRIHSAMLAQSDRFGNFAHGFTYAGHPVAAAVALEVQKIYAEMDIVARAKRLGCVLGATLGRLKAHRLVGDVRGVGLIAGIELMRDGAFATQAQCRGRVEEAARRHRLILRSWATARVCAALVIRRTKSNQIGEQQTCAERVAMQLDGGGWWQLARRRWRHRLSVRQWSCRVRRRLGVRARGQGDPRMERSRPGCCGARGRAGLASTAILTAHVQVPMPHITQRATASRRATDRA